MNVNYSNMFTSNQNLVKLRWQTRNERGDSLHTLYSYFALRFTIQYTAIDF